MGKKRAMHNENNKTKYILFNFYVTVATKIKRNNEQKS